MESTLALCAGFLLAVLWFDLMFDVQVLRPGAGEGPLPEEVLASIASYYRRVTTRARPMTHLVALVMLVTVGGTIAQVVRGTAPLAFRLGALALCVTPILAAGLRTVPHAIRLGGRGDPPAVQSALARGICRDHLVFFPMMAAFAAIQLLAR